MYTPLALPRAGPRFSAPGHGPLSMNPPALVLEGLPTSTAAPPGLLPPEESLVPDARAGLSAGQMVDRRLRAMLGHLPAW